MDKREEEQRIFDMAKQDIPFLRQLKLVKHDDRPDFILKDKDGRKIGLEHFRADVYRVQDANSTHISGGHTILNNSKEKMFERYNPYTVNDTWNNEITKQAAEEIGVHVNESLDMRSHYEYGAFLDNLRVGIHGRQSKVKGHVQKSKNYPGRESYDLMGFLIEIPVPSFEYCFETTGSRTMSQAKSLLYGAPINSQGCVTIPKRFKASHQKINGLPITDEIWRELSIFDDIDFIIIETYNASSLKEHHGQYFDKNTPKPQIYPAFSFGFNDVESMSVEIGHEDNNFNIKVNLQTNLSNCEGILTNTKLKAERRRQARKTRRYFDKAARKLRGM